MLDAEYLRRQAETCTRLARTTFDLATAEQLRFLGNELRAKAEEIDETVQPHMMGGNKNGSATGDNGRN